MSEADPLAGGGSPATPAGSADSPTAAGACPWSPRSPRTAAAAPTSCGDATASWPGVAFPRRRASPTPVGGAWAVIMAPTPPRYVPRPPATPTQAPATTRISAQGRLQSLSVSSNKVGEGIEKIYGSAKDGEGAAKLYGKAMMMGLAAADFCNRKGWTQVPQFFEENIINFTDWSQLPGVFKGLSCVFGGASQVIQGSAEAFGSMGVSSRIFHAAYTYIPSFSYTLPTARRVHRAYAGSSCPQQGINCVLSYQIVKRSSVDSVLFVQESNESRRSPKKVLRGVLFIRTLSELKDTVKKFKKGDPVHLIDVSEEDVPLETALEFWNHLLAQGATALLRRDSNLCRMSKIAYSLLEEKRSLQTELDTLNCKIDEIKHTITVLSDMLMNTKPKLAKTGPSRSIDFTGVGANLPSASTTVVPASDKKDPTLLASQERVRTVKVTNVFLSATEQDIKEFFSFSGDIEHVEMQSGDESSQLAYVTFKDAQGAETAVLHSGATIVDLCVIIQPAPEYQPPPTVSATPME